MAWSSPVTFSGTNGRAAEGRGAAVEPCATTEAGAVGVSTGGGAGGGASSRQAASKITSAPAPATTAEEEASSTRAARSEDFTFVRAEG